MVGPVAIFVSSYAGVFCELFHIQTPLMKVINLADQTRCVISCAGTRSLQPATLIVAALSKESFISPPKPLQNDVNYI